MKKIFVFLLLVLSSLSQISAQLYEVEKSTFVYKSIDGIELEMVMYQPQVTTASKLPAIATMSGCSMLYAPAEPQQKWPSGTS